MTLWYLLIVFNIPAITGIVGGTFSFLYLLAAFLLFFLPSVIATAQLAVMFPYEGALYNWTAKALGGFWSFFSVGAKNAWGNNVID